MLTAKNPHVPQWKLRRVGPRAVRIFERHRGRSVVIEAFGHTLVPAVNQYVGLYDSIRAGTTSAREVTEGRQAVTGLRTTIRSCLGLLARDIPGFNAQSFDKRSPVPDDVIGSAHRLLEVVRSARVGGEPLHYAAQIEELVGNALEAAETEWREAQDQLAADQARLAETRQAAAVLNRELVAFRRTLALQLGTKHRDYRSLRTAAVSRSADDEDFESVEGIDDEHASADQVPMPEAVISTPSPTPAPAHGVHTPGAVTHGAQSNGAGTHHLDEEVAAH